MALISEWMQQCGKKVLDNAGIVREACLQHLSPRWRPHLSDLKCRSTVIIASRRTEPPVLKCSSETEGGDLCTKKRL
jgi:hypothetical protein